MQSSSHTLLPKPLQDVINRLAAVFAESERELVLVGGVVRDSLLGIELRPELDFATNALPPETEALGLEAGADSSYLVGVQFGTVGFVFNPEEEETSETDSIIVEITTYRAEHYPDDTRKPVVEFGETLMDDLSRRDFTFNAIARHALTNELYDPFLGQADLEQGVIRAVGDPHDRFQEDPLRILRAARFVSQLGFAIETETRAAIEQQAASLQRISQERIFSELDRLLRGPYASFGLNTLRDTGLLPYTIPELVEVAFDRSVDAEVHREKDLWEHTTRVVDRAPSEQIVRWAALLHDAAKPGTRSVGRDGEIHFFGHEHEGAMMAATILSRLKAGKALQESIVRVVELHGRPENYDDSWSDSAVRRLMLDAGDDIDDLLTLAAADVTSRRAEKQKAAEQRVSALRQRIEILREEQDLNMFESPLDGNELMAMFNRPPGRWIAEIKTHLRELVIDGELPPGDKHSAILIARELLQERSEETAG